MSDDAANRVRARTATAAEVREAQGRLFFAWLFTLPIVLAAAGSWALGSPWPSPPLHRALMLILAFPVLFVVGGDTLTRALGNLRRGRLGIDQLAAAAALAAYASGILALFLPVVGLAGAAAVIMTIHLTGRYLRLRRAGDAAGRSVRTME